MKTTWCSFALVAVLAGCGPSAQEIARTKHDQEVTAAAVAKQKFDSETIKSAEEYASHDMLDPNSVQFRDVILHKDYVCGELNAKNSYGAYVGFQPFFAARNEGKRSLDNITGVITSRIPAERALKCQAILRRVKLDGTENSVDPEYDNLSCSDVPAQDMVFWSLSYPENCGTAS